MTVVYEEPSVKSSLDRELEKIGIRPPNERLVRNPAKPETPEESEISVKSFFTEDYVMPERKSPIFNPNRIEIPGGGVAVYLGESLPEVYKPSPEIKKLEVMEVNGSPR